METLTNDCGQKWNFDKVGIIEFSWEAPFISTKISVKWRGIIFHCRIVVKKTEFGWRKEVTYNYNNQIYRTGFVKWKWAGGSIGVTPPEIATSAHLIKVLNSYNSISFKDECFVEDFQDDAQKNIFEILDTPDEIVFDQIDSKNESNPFSFRVVTNEVTLYEFKDTSIVLNGYAYFENKQLVVDFWELSGNYETDKFIKIDESNLSHLYEAFKLEKDKKAELLIGILNAFHGKDYFKKIKDYLDFKKIAYHTNSRYDN